MDIPLTEALVMSSASPDVLESVRAGLPLDTVIAFVLVKAFVAANSGTTAEFTLRLVLLPRATDPPPMSPVPAVTVREECCSMLLVTPAVAMLSAPVVVIGPPVRPEPLATLVTVPVPALAQAHAVPLYCSTWLALHGFSPMV